MADQPGGQPPVDNPDVQPGPTQTGGPQEPQTGGGQPPQEPDLPEKFRGKSPQEIVQMYQSLEQMAGHQGEELGALRNNYSQLADRVSQMSQQPAQQQPGPQQPAPQGQWNWDNPGASAQQATAPMVNQAIGQFGVELSENISDLAFEAAKAKDPGLFVGVEAETRQFVKNSIRNGVLRPTAGMTPETWRMAAWQMQGIRQSYKWTPQGVQQPPVNPPVTNIPSQKPPYSGGPSRQPSATEQAFLDKMKVSKEDQDRILKELGTEGKR